MNELIKARSWRKGVRGGAGARRWRVAPRLVRLRRWRGVSWRWRVALRASRGMRRGVPQVLSWRRGLRGRALPPAAALLLASGLPPSAALRERMSAHGQPVQTRTIERHTVFIRRRPPLSAAGSRREPDASASAAAVLSRRSMAEQTAFLRAPARPGAGSGLAEPEIAAGRPPLPWKRALHPASAPLPARAATVAPGLSAPAAPSSTESFGKLTLAARRLQQAVAVEQLVGRARLQPVSARVAAPKELSSQSSPIAMPRVPLSWRTREFGAATAVAAASETAFGTASTQPPQLQLTAAEAQLPNAAPAHGRGFVPRALPTLAPAEVERLADDIMRRIERRARIERERRGA